MSQESKKIVIFGANSAIAQAVSKIFLKQNHQLLLVGRNENRLKNIADDYSIRSGKEIKFITCDLNLLHDHNQLLETIMQKLGHIDIALLAHGTLPDQKEAEREFGYTEKTLTTNLLSHLSLLTLLANLFEKQKKGSIAVISSVAGDRGRQSNYVYGTAKAALNTFLQGLRNRLNRCNVNVLTIKPGFIETPMTKDFKKGLLWVKPEMIAPAIVKAILNNTHEIYVPQFWRYIMFIIKSIPECIFCKLKL